MNWHNPRVSWSELERQMSGRPENRRPPSLVNAEDDSAPGFSASDPRTRRPRWTIDLTNRSCRTRSCTATATSASWMGPAIPKPLIEEAVRLNLIGLAITDHDGFYAPPGLRRRRWPTT